MRKNKEKALSSVNSIFIKHVDAAMKGKKKLPSKKSILKKVIDALGAETDSPSFYQGKPK